MTILISKTLPQEPVSYHVASSRMRSAAIIGIAFTAIALILMTLTFIRLPQFSTQLLDTAYASGGLAFINFIASAYIWKNRVNLVPSIIPEVSPNLPPELPTKPQTPTPKIFEENDHVTSILQFLDCKEILAIRTTSRPFYTASRTVAIQQIKTKTSLSLEKIHLFSLIIFGKGSDWKRISNYLTNLTEIDFSNFDFNFISLKHLNCLQTLPTERLSQITSINFTAARNFTSEKIITVLSKSSRLGQPPLFPNLNSLNFLNGLSSSYSLKLLTACCNFVVNGFGTIINHSGTTYIGKWLEGVLSEGTQTWLNGDTYVGQWQNDRKHGEGTLTLASGIKYVGQWQEDRQHGEGTLTFSSGDKYVGQWRDGTLTQGKIIYSNGDEYEGELTNAGAHGRGVKTSLSPKSTYIGDFQEGRFHGHGTLIYPNRAVYIGKWKNGQVEGSLKLVSTQ